jgi:hypothetical protein
LIQEDEAIVLEYLLHIKTVLGTWDKKLSKRQ